MAMSTFQKVTLATCLVLCVALLLPKMLLSRGRKDPSERPDGSGHFPPMVHRQKAPERGAGAGLSRAHNPEAIARAKGAGPGTGAGGKSNLAGQIIPVYGFGILLYILYILFKITSKGNSKPSESRFPSFRSENMKRKITDFELTQLQEKLRETELVMENIVSKAQHSPDRLKGVTADQEASLLQQLTEITRVMQEGQLVEDMNPEKKIREDWEDYPEELRSYWDQSHCCCHHTQTEAERTRSDEPNTENIPEDGTAAREHKDLSRESGEEHTAPESNLPVTGSVHGHKEGGATMELGVPEEELAGALEKLELSMKVTSMVEEEMGDLTRLVETEASCGTVRRRNKRRRTKKMSH